jgi:outer membrane protein
MNGQNLIHTIHRTFITLCLLLAASANATEQTTITPNALKTQTTNNTQDGALRLTVMDAILLGLENNQSLRVQRFEPAISQTYEQQEEAVFDTVFTGGVSGQKSIAEEKRTEVAGMTDVEAKTVDGLAGISKFLPTGTKISIDGTTNLVNSSDNEDNIDSTRAGVSITQSLLKGMGTSVNLASLRQARLDTLSTEYQLRGFAESLVANIETTYWDYALAQRKVEIYTDSLHLAEQQLAETRERIAVGKMAELDLSAASAEVASRQAILINARSVLNKVRIQLLSLLNPGGSNAFQREISLLDQPVMPPNDMDEVSTHVAVAMRMRPDLNETRLAIQSGDLEVVKTRNGLLPQLDLFIMLGSSGYANSFRSSSRNINGDFYDAAVGLKFAYPLGNNDAQAQYHRAKLSRDQSTEILANMQQLAEVDVRLAYLDIGRAREEIAATAVLVKLREETVKFEVEKFRIGRSTPLLVAQTQRDLLISQILQIEVTVNYIKSFVNLYLSEGSLLERRGISTPGREPVPSSQ